jgi:hypothetical protein
VDGDRGDMRVWESGKGKDLCAVRFGFRLVSFRFDRGDLRVDVSDR